VGPTYREHLTMTIHSPRSRQPGRSFTDIIGLLLKLLQPATPPERARGPRGSQETRLVSRRFPVYIWEQTRPNVPAPIPELSVVALTHPLEHKARKLPEGTVGTVVHAWSDGEHYAVEFKSPFPCVVSLLRADIQPV
jgi:hypothetical protein